MLCFFQLISNDFSQQKNLSELRQKWCVFLLLYGFIYILCFFFPPLRGHGGEVVWVWVFWGLQNRVSATAAFAVCLLALLGVSEWTPVCSVCFCQGRDPKGAFNYLCSQQSSHAEVCTLAKASRLGTFLKIDCHKEDIFRNTMLHIICSIWNNRFKVRLIKTYLVFDWYSCSCLLNIFFLIIYL